MIYSANFKVLLDANVLYPAPLRDLLLSLAFENLYKPFWTDEIQNEWKRSLLKNRKKLKAKNLNLTISAMNKAFPDANITGYEKLEEGLDLPDQDDRHVLAAAIKANAEIIVTFNLKHFPKNKLKEFDITPQSPDDFIVNTIQLNPERGLQAFEKQVRRLKNPPKSKAEVLQSLLNNNIPKTVELLENLL